MERKKKKCGKKTKFIISTKNKKTKKGKSKYL